MRSYGVTGHGKKYNRCCLILWVKKNLRKGIAPHIFFKNSDDTANDLTPKKLQFFPGLFQ